MVVVRQRSKRDCQRWYNGLTDLQLCLDVRLTLLRQGIIERAHLTFQFSDSFLLALFPHTVLLNPRKHFLFELSESMLKHPPNLLVLVLDTFELAAVAIG